MAYVNVIGSTDTLLEKLRSAKSQLLQIYKTVRQVKVLEQMANLEREGYDPWPIDDDANALQMDACTALYNNIITTLLDATPENWRYGYLIKAGRPAGVTGFVLGDNHVYAYPLGYSPFDEVVPTDKVTLRFTDYIGAQRELTGLIVDTVTVAGGQIDFTTDIFPEIISEGDFASVVDWDFVAPWVHDTDHMDGTLVGTTLHQHVADFLVPVVVGQYYTIVFEITNYSAGSIYVDFCGTHGTVRSANGVYTETLLCANLAAPFELTPTGFTGTVDNVSIVEWHQNQTPGDVLVEVELEATDV